MHGTSKTIPCYGVTPLAGVWVEIDKSFTGGQPDKVTPLAGVWVEIVKSTRNILRPRVTPLAGVWVEITCAKA